MDDTAACRGHTIGKLAVHRDRIDRVACGAVFDDKPADDVDTASTAAPPAGGSAGVELVGEQQGGSVSLRSFGYSGR